MKTMLLVTVAIFAGLSSAALAAPKAPETEAAQEAQAEQASSAVDEAEPQEEKKICRTDRTTGSLTRRTRVCMTETQWREVHDRTRRGVGEMQGSAAGGMAIPNNPGG